MSPSIKLVLVVGLACLATPARAIVLLRTLSNLTASSNLTRVALVRDDELSGLVTTTEDDLWTTAVARSTKLLQGMKASDAEAATLYGLGTTAESPFDGDLIDKLQEWGYNDDNDVLAKQADPECNFDSRNGHMLAKAFGELNIGVKSKSKGGPNQCFLIEHFDGPAVKKGDGGKMPAKADQRYDVCGKEYRVTNAEHTIGANAESGAVYAMQISSAAKAARQLWKRVPLTEELPAIRSVSDIAWAFWNRVHQDGGLDNIKYLFVMMIINKETNQHVKRALGTLSPPKEEADGWPGNDFSMDTDEGKALLGSPVGRWAGYFLLQHKRQLGSNKYISKVRVFKSEKEGSWPYFLFYVEGPAAMAGKMTERSDFETWSWSERPKIVRRSEDGKHVIREHVVRVRL